MKVRMAGSSCAGDVAAVGRTLHCRRCPSERRMKIHPWPLDRVSTVEIKTCSYPFASKRESSIRDRAALGGYRFGRDPI
jgi:hypothetical protein